MLRNFSFDWRAISRDPRTAVRAALGREEGRFRELFHARFRRPLLIAVALMAFSQLCGINAIMYYSTKIFESAGAMTMTLTCCATICSTRRVFSSSEPSHQTTLSGWQSRAISSTRAPMSPS